MQEGPEKKLIFSPTPVLQVQSVSFREGIPLGGIYSLSPTFVVDFPRKVAAVLRKTKREVQRHPVLVPSFQRLDDEQQELILYCLKAPKIPEKKVTCLET